MKWRFGTLMWGTAARPWGLSPRMRRTPAVIRRPLWSIRWTPSGSGRPWVHSGRTLPAGRRMGLHAGQPPGHIDFRHYSPGQVVIFLKLVCRARRRCAEFAPSPGKRIVRTVKAHGMPVAFHDHSRPGDAGYIQSCQKHETEKHAVHVQNESCPIFAGADLLPGPLQAGKTAALGPHSAVEHSWVNVARS